MDEAAKWRERLLATADTGYLPPVALRPMKVRALEALAEHWLRGGRKDGAVRVLRLAIDLAQGRLAGGGAVSGDYLGACSG